MVDKLVDSLRQQRDLDVGRTCVRLTNLVIADQLRALLFLQSHRNAPPYNRAGAWARPAFITLTFIIPYPASGAARLPSAGSRWIRIPSRDRKGAVPPLVHGHGSPRPA